jgi:hypothetical protein
MPLQETPEPGDRVQFAADAGGNQVMQGEGFVMAVDNRTPQLPFAFIAIVGVPTMVMLPAQMCRVIEKSALIRRVQLS